MSKLMTLKQLPTEVLDICNDLLSGKSPGDLGLKSMGSGSDGEVFQIEDDICIKVFFKSSQNKNDHVALSALQGIPSVPEIYAYAEEKFIVLERVKGQSIDDYVDKNRALPPNLEELIKNELHLMKDKNYFFTDFKLGEHTFWIKETQSVKFVDFGLMDHFDHNNQSSKDQYLEGILSGVRSEIAQLEFFIEHQE
ncbi:AarF/UbiB family protein [Priestia megaterium]|uniref:AarF/UbiB family protein n=1 Tax=Priestia megaterium TaxID=1404 RepID=UPI000BFD40D9|nr:AarF/UbiB family protein [Priestia megaterium]PGR09156.1 hypothetical protein COA23_08045 [Priestia megaterium]